MTLAEKVLYLLPQSLNEFSGEFIKGFYEDVSDKTIDTWHVSEAIRRITASTQDVCSRDKVCEVIAELDRREVLQRKLWWDVKFLITNNKATVSLDNTLILFKSYFGSKFSNQDWTEFLSKRSRTGPASFLELRNAICNFIPTTDSNDDIEEIMMELQKQPLTVKFSESENERQNRRNRYRAKANAWLGEQAKVLQANLMDNDIFFTALQIKYKILCKVALTQAIERLHGEEAWLIKTEQEKYTMISDMEQKAQTLRSMGRLLYCDHALQIKGLLAIKSGLYNVMGLKQYETNIFTTKMIKHREKLFRAGRDESYVKEVEMLEYTKKRKEHEVNSTNILNDLEKRYKEEKDLLKKELEGSLGHIRNKRQKEVMLALLYFIHHRASSESAFRPTVISVSLAEHMSPLPEERLFEDYDRWYDLARYRVTKIVFEDEYDRMTGQPLLPLSLPPVMALTAAQNTMRNCFVMLQRAHDAECVYLQMLLYSDLDEEDHIRLLSSTEVELEEALAYLRQQRRDWRLRVNSSHDDGKEKLSDHYEILKKAMFIMVLLVQYKHDLLDDADSAMVVVMSELIQLQEIEIALLIHHLPTMSSDGVQEWLEALGVRCKQGYNDNVAHVLLRGVAQYDDSWMLEVIYTKYEAIKQVWMRQTLASNKQSATEAEWLVKERDLYNAGELYDAKNVFGDCVVHKKGLHGLMGPNREITADQVYSGDDHVIFESEPTENILMDIQFRYKDDKAYLLSEIKGNRARIYEGALIQLQIYILQEYSDFDSAANYIGLLEKVHLHPQYKLSENAEVLKTIAEHVLCCYSEPHPVNNYELLSRDVFLEGSFRQVLRKTMLYLLQKKHSAEQKVFSRILHSATPQTVPEDSLKEKLMLKVKEKVRVKELRKELSSGQVAGAFLAALQQKQIVMFTEAVESSGKGGSELMSLLLFCQMDEAATCIADMLTMGKLELSVLVSAVRQGITCGYNDNIAKILYTEDVVTKSRQDLAGWLDHLIKSYVMSAGKQKGLSIPQREDLYKEVTSQETLTPEFLPNMGITTCPNMVNTWGLLPGYFTQVLEGLKIEEQLLKDEELSPEEMETRLKDLFEVQSNEWLVANSNVIVTLYNHRASEIDHVFRTSDVAMTTLYVCYGNTLLQQELVPTPILTCYLSHLMRMMVSPDHVIHGPSVRAAAQAFLAGYTAEWAAKTPLGSGGMLSLVRDYNTIHYTVSSYRKYILSCVHKHHAMEISLLCRLLLELRPEEVMSEMERAREMKTAHAQWQRVNTELRAMTVFNEKSAEQISKLHEQQRALLSDSLSLKYGTIIKRVRYKEGHGSHASVSHDDAKVEMLCELLRHHIQDIADSVRSLREMTMLELASLKITLHHNIKAGLVGAVALVCFTPAILTKDEQLAQEIEGKYDQLKDKLYAATLMKEIGEKEWALLSEQERQKKILELKRQAAKMRREGKEDELEKMFADALSNEKGMIELIGMSKESYLKALEAKRKLRKELRKVVTEDGVEVEMEVEVDEEGNIVEKKFNSIMDALDSNFEAEKDELMKRLRETSDEFACARERQAQMVRLRLEKKKLEQEGNFSQAALILNQANAMGERQLSEKERQMALAKARIAARRSKLSKTSSGVMESTPEIDIDTDDAVDLHAKLAELVHAKHEYERDVLQQMLGSLSTEQREVVRDMTSKERREEIGLLREDRRKWREEIAEEVPSAEELTSKQIKNKQWMSQGAILHLTNLFDEIEIAYDDSIDDPDERRADFMTRQEEEGLVQMLVKLQQKQDDEAAMLLGNIKHKGLAAVQSMCLVHKRALNEGWLDNVAAVVFSRQVAETQGEQDVVKELETKYDNIKDKLILQMLEQQMGADEWAKLSEKDRQKKLMQLKYRDRRLRAAGREGEADELYKAMIDVQRTREINEEEAKKNQRERIKARLEFKKRRQAEGASKQQIEEEIDEMKREEGELDSQNKESVSAKNILDSLMEGFEKEKEMLLSQLRDEDGKVRNEKARQLALLKLKRDQLKMKKNADADAAALVFGKALAKDRRLEDQRKEQLSLAKQRLLARRERSKALEETDDYFEELKDISNVEDAATTLQTSILQLIEQKHESEREMFIGLVRSLAGMEEMSPEEKQLIRSSTEEENNGRIVNLRRHRLRALKSVKTAKDQETEEERLSEFRDLQRAYLQEALAIKILSGLGDMEEGEIAAATETAAVGILATLQEYQDNEDEELMVEMSEMDVGRMSETRQMIHGHMTSSLFTNLCDLILGEVTPEDINVKADQMNLKRYKRDKDLKAAMEKRKKDREVKKRQKKENLALLLKDLNHETERNVEDATLQYEKYKDALDQLLKKKDFVHLTTEEEAMLAKAQEMMKKMKSTEDEDDDDVTNTLKSLSQEDRDELFNQLKEQHKSQMNQISAQKDAQKKAMLAKLRIKAAVREKKDDEEDAMISMFGDFSRSQTIVREKTMVGQNLQKEKLAVILAKKRQLTEAARVAKEKTLIKEEDLSSTETTESSVLSPPVSRPGSRLLSSREGSRMSTVELSGQLGDDHKKEMFDTLVRQATSAEVSKSRQRSKQEEQLRARIRARQMVAPGSGTKRDKVQEEAEEILGALERDKTQLQIVHSQESARQKTIIRDRIRRIREKTMTGAAAGDPSPLTRQSSDLGFSSHLTEEDKLLPKNEQMALVAARMQDKFKKTSEDTKALEVLQEDGAN